MCQLFLSWRQGIGVLSRIASKNQSTSRAVTRLPPLALLNHRFLYTGSLSTNQKKKTSVFKGQQSQVPYCIFHKYKPIMDAPTGVFRGSVDRFNGITVDSKQEYDAESSFKEKLEKSLTHWSVSGRRAIWFKVRTLHSSWVPELAANGFDFHHAKAGYVLMNRWLPTNESANIPVFAHTMVGVGGLVVNSERNEILVVTDRYAIIPNSWKLPGGYVEPDENLVDAAIREVREETGITSEFETVVSLRHSHGGSFQCSDIYVVVGLRPKNLNFTQCEREISRLQWMPIAEYLQHPNVHETNRHFLRTFLDYKERQIQFTCETATHSVLRREYRLYYMKALALSNNDNNADGDADKQSVIEKSSL